MNIQKSNVKKNGSFLWRGCLFATPSGGAISIGAISIGAISIGAISIVRVIFPTGSKDLED